MSEHAMFNVELTVIVPSDETTPEGAEAFARRLIHAIDRLPGVRGSATSGWRCWSVDAEGVEGPALVGGDAMTAGAALDDLYERQAESDGLRTGDEA